MICLVLLLCFHGAAAHARDLGREHSHASIHHDAHDAGTLFHGAERPQAFMSMHGSAANEENGKLKLLLELPKHLKGQCVWMLIAICSMCCFGQVLRDCVGQTAGSIIGLCVTFGTVGYLLYSGIYSAYWAGQDVGIVCKVMCWWAIFLMVFWSCVACTVCCCAGLMLGIKNIAIKEMRKQYDAKMLEISGPRREYYESDCFKEKCNRMFEKADKDGNGTLDMAELQDVLVEATGDANIAGITPLLQQAFEEHGDSVVEKHEFLEMMKYVSVVALQEGRVTLEQAFEILQCPETASKSEVRKAYHKLASKYHPDKLGNVGADPEKLKRDMAEVNDAHAKVQEHFKEKDVLSPDKQEPGS